ncbi:MAG TPA: hypothetical protein DDZ80_22940 [Cyanobacteria bacterium UBA8803]|nr:hypothetical protein [Cyanobacteria bacterium UBA9273]HBL61184.1 hypothetical protein [Cyanobacteria bacterium UBA8803]
MDSNRERLYAVAVLARYWPGREEEILKLPIPQAQSLKSEPLPPQLEAVELPDWSEEVGVGGKLLVPMYLILEGKEPTWRRTDWLSVIFWYLNGSAEQAFEQLHGPIHSYSLRLKGWDSRLWERAWVNRIALFLRRWAAKEQSVREELLLGNLPEPEIILTHDVDAIAKTVAIRFKQAAFYSFNAVRQLLQGRLYPALNHLTGAVKFLVSQDDYWCFDEIAALEEKYGVRSHFNVYGGLGGWQRTPKELLIDPAYNPDDPRLKQQLQQLHSSGWTIGLHQSCNAWADPQLMQWERQRLEGVLGASVTSCRQHWLYFSWERTWKAQQEAGFLLDSTLGFNDRPSFRTGAALQYHPWYVDSQEPMNLEVLPMVLMDSHLYYYADLTDNQRQQQMSYWLDEIRAVRGTASVIWHQRVMSEDYGWAAGYEILLSMSRSGKK